MYEVLACTITVLLFMACYYLSNISRQIKHMTEIQQKTVNMLSDTTYIHLTSKKNHGELVAINEKLHNISGILSANRVDKIKFNNTGSDCNE